MTPDALVAQLLHSEAPTHARPSLPTNHHPNLTPANLGQSATHETAATHTANISNSLFISTEEMQQDRAPISKKDSSSLIAPS